MADDLNQRFQEAAAAAKQLPSRPSDGQMLELYALYKQGSSGDVSGDRPGGFDFVGGAKYDAWEKLKGLSREEAMQKYIDTVERLKG